MKEHEHFYLLEPQCYGFEHAPFNAAMLTHLIARGNAKISFFAEKTHIECVRAELKPYIDDSAINYCHITIPKRSIHDWNRVRNDFILANRIISSAIRMNIGKILILSSTNTFFIAIKTIMFLNSSAPSTAIIMHSVLSGIEGPQAKNPFKWPLGIRRAILFPSPIGLTVNVLGASILKNVKKEFPKTCQKWESIDHPYLWDQDVIEKMPSKPIKFGFIGASSKGFDQYLKLVERIEPSANQAIFFFIGFYSGQYSSLPQSKYIPTIPTKPLNREEMKKQILELDYIVWTSSPSRYKYTASGSFLDAIAFLKPGIYLRNDYIEHYFKNMGDIGYLCDSFEHMYHILTEVIAQFPEERYLNQVQNILANRQIFQPAAISTEFFK